MLGKTDTILVTEVSTFIEPAELLARVVSLPLQLTQHLLYKMQVTRKGNNPTTFLATSECYLRQGDKFISLLIYQILTIHLWPSHKEKLCS